MLFTPHMHLRTVLQGIVLAILMVCTSCQSDLPIPVAGPTEDPSEQWQTLLEQSVSIEGIDWNLIDPPDAIQRRVIPTCLNPLEAFIHLRRVPGAVRSL